MAVFTVPNIYIKGIAASVPKQVEDNEQFSLINEAERAMFIKTVGIRYRRVAEAGITASDLCYAAADKLLNELNWNREEVKVLVFVTQTPDYISPNTSSLLQEKLEFELQSYEGKIVFVKGKIENEQVFILEDQESYLVNSFAIADGIVQLPEEKETFEKGEIVSVLMI